MNERTGVGGKFNAAEAAKKCIHFLPQVSGRRVGGGREGEQSPSKSLYTEEKD